MHLAPGQRGQHQHPKIMGWVPSLEPLRLGLAILAMTLVTALGAPTITNQPTTATVILNGSAGSMSVTATSSGGTLHYQWYEGLSGDTSRPIGYDMATTSAHPTTPSSSTDTHYWVRVTDNNGSTDSAAAPVIVIPAAPNTVIASNNLFPNRVRVTWNPFSQPHTFNVYRATTNSFAASTLLGASISGTSYDDTSALPGTTYYYFVKAKDAENQESSHSSLESFNNGLRATGQLDGTFIPVREVADYAFSQDSTELFVALQSGFVERYQIASATISNSYPIGGKIRAVDIAEDDAFLLLTTQDIPSGNGLVRKLALPSGQVTSFPYELEDNESISYDVSIVSDHEALVTGTYAGSGWVPLRRLNPQTGVYSVLISDVRQYTFMARTPSRSHVGIFEGDSSGGPWFLYDRQTQSFSTSNQLNASQFHASLKPDGSLIAMKHHSIGIKIFDAAGALVQTIPGIGSAAGNQFLPQSNEFAVADKAQDSIRFYDTNTWEEIDNMPVGEDLGSGFDRFKGGHMEASPDGNWIAITTALGVRVIQVYHPQIPPAALDLTATDLTHSDKLRLSWTAAPEATSYAVYRHTESNPTAATVLNSNVTSTLYDDTTAIPLTQYYYWVTAKNRAGTSGFSVSDLGMRQMPVPGSLSASTTNTATVTVTWTFDTFPGNFEIYRGTTNQLGDAALLTSVASTIRSHGDTTAVPGTEYYYWVRKLSPAGNSAFSGPALGYRRLATPTGLTATTHLGSKVTVTWQPVPGALQYQVYFKTTQTGFNGTERLVGTTAGTTIDDPYTNFSPGTTYYWSVRAVSGANMSAFPNGAAGRRILVPPQTVTATSNLLDRITVSWSNENDGNTHYRILRSQTNNPATMATVQNVTAATTQWSDLTAAPNVTYYYWVISFTFSNPPVESDLSPSAAGRRLGLGFTDYQSRYNLSGNNAVLTNDPDGDQYPTILEWGLGGTHPLSQSSAPLLRLGTVTVSGETYQSVCYLRLITGVETGNRYQTTYLRYEAEATSDLTNWTIVPVAAPAPSGLAAPPDGYEWGCFRMPGTVAQYPTGFFRLRLSVN